MKQKLSSRKFWIGLLVVAVGIALCCLGDRTNGLTLISIGSLSYLGAEGLVDIFRIVFTSGLFSPEVETAGTGSTAEEQTSDTKADDTPV